MVSDVFQRIKDAKGTKEKLKIAIEEFTTKHHRFLEVCFNFEVYGISSSGWKKAIQYDEKLFGKTEDLGEFIEKLDYDDFEDRFEDVRTTYNYQIEDFVTVLKNNSGNKQIEELRKMLGGLEQDTMVWTIRALTKNMRFGLNLSSYNKVRKAHNLDEIIPKGVQLCGKRLLDDIETLSYPRIAEYKYDGERTEIKIVRDVQTKRISVTLTSRSQNDITERYPEIVLYFIEMFENKPEVQQIIFDSEVISSSFIKLSTRMHRKSENIKENDDDLRAIIFDVLEFNYLDLRQYHQGVRRRLLDISSSKYGFDTSYMEIVNTPQELTDFYNKARSIDQEGVVSKDLNMKWTEHSRTGWYKMVPKENIDLKIVECYYGNGKFSKQINGVICENKDGTIRTKASSGIKNFERELLTNLHENGELIGKIVEISYRELTPSKDGVSALRFPVFIRLREDKFEAD